MKQSSLLIGGIALLLNVLLGVLISKYALFNVCLNSAVIVVTTLLLWLLSKLEMRDAFRISLLFLFSFIGIVEFFLGFFSKGTITDNWPIIVDVILLAIEIVFLFLATYLSKTINK